MLQKESSSSAREIPGTGASVPGTHPASARLGGTNARILFGFFALSLALQLLIYAVVTNKPVIRSDGVGYHAYLPAMLVDRDLSFAAYRQREFPEGIPYWTGIHPGPRAYVIKYPLGLAVLESPFFLAAQLASRLAGYGSVYAWPYQVAAAVSGAWYFGCGALCLWLLLRRQFPTQVAWPALLLTVFGTNLLHYATYDIAFSHVYSFCLIVALLLVSRDLYRAPAWRWLVLGLLAGLTVATRPNNGIFIVLVLAEWFTAAGSGAEGLRRMREEWRGVSLALVAGAAPIALQFLYWRLATGQWFYYTYINEGFNFLAPAGWRALCGFEKGWFVYLPLTVLAVVGWAVARRQLVPRAPVVLAFMIANIWIIASWHDWGYGGAFSMRPLAESAPLVALGVAGLLAWAWPKAWLRRLCLTLGGLCAVYTTILMVGYWTHTLPYIEATGDDILRCLMFSGPRH